MDGSNTLSREDLEFHRIMLSRTQLKSSMRTSTLVAGFAFVSDLFIDTVNHTFSETFRNCK